MRTFVRILVLLKPFAGLFLLALVLSAIFSLLTTASVALIHPVLKVLFGSTQSTVVAPADHANFLERAKYVLFSTLNQFLFSDSLHITLVRLCILIIAVFTAKNVFKYWSRVVNAQLVEQSTKYLRDLLFQKMTKLSLDFFYKQKSGDLISLVTNDVAVVNNTVAPVFTVLVREPLQVILLFLFLLSLSMKLTFIALLSSFASVGIVLLSKKYLRRYAMRIQDAMAEYSSVLEETLGGIKIIKILSAENSAIQKFRKQTDRYVRAMIKHQKVLGLIPSLSEILAILALTVVLYMGAQEVFQQRMSGEELMTFLFALFSIMSPVVKLVGVPSMMQRGLVAAERVFNVLDKTPSIQSGTLPCQSFQEKLEIEDLWFAYEDNRYVLKGIHLVIPKGKTIALVGESGSGKTTLVDLILRLYDPQKGRILLDGTDIREFELGEYHSLFGVVTQEPILFNDSILNNVRIAKPDSSEEQVMQALRAANAEGFIQHLPQGIHTVVGDRGVRLSGGQRQRIAIARALLANPPILILDEATSSLDSHSEKAVQDAIDKLLKGRTAIVIAHRLSTIRNADWIIVLKKGIIVEQGTHNELLLKNGEYAHLIEVQELDRRKEVVERYETKE